jgi:excisionase family DNA binding protein
MTICKKDVYDIIFKNYPDVMDVKQVSEILGVSTKTVYKQIKDGELQCIKIGREFRIPKVSILNYLKVFNIETKL